MAREGSSPLARHRGQLLKSNVVAKEEGPCEGDDRLLRRQRRQGVARRLDYTEAGRWTNLTRFQLVSHTHMYFEENLQETHDETSLPLSLCLSETYSPRHKIS